MDGSTYSVRFEYWRRIVIACNNRTPGMKKGEWLEQNGINRHSFYNWQAKIRRAAAEELSLGQLSSAHGEYYRSSATSYLILFASLSALLDTDCQHAF